MLHTDPSRAKEKAKDLHNKHSRFIERATELALKSDVKAHRHGCVIVSNRGKIVSEGFNHMWFEVSIHAEQDAISKLKTMCKVDINQCTMYVIRIGTNNMGTPLKFSRPCEKCTHAILKSGIKKVYYSTSYDFLMCTQNSHF